MVENYIGYLRNYKSSVHGGEGKKKETNQLQSNDRISIITWAKIRVIYQQNLGEMQIIVYCAGEIKRGGDGMAEFSFVFNK